MKGKTLIYLLLCFLAFGSSGLGQRPKKAPLAKPVKKPLATKSLLPAEYEYRFYLDSKNNLNCTVVSLTNGKYLEPPQRSRAMRAIFASPGDRMALEVSAPPRVVIEADPSLDISRVLDVISELRVSDEQDIELGLPDDLHLLVSKMPQKRPDVIVFPNPLTLVVRLDDKKNITLNNQNLGVYPAFDQLTNRLLPIFKERENNGVLRKGTYDVEKTVKIVIPLTGYHLSDLVLVAQALRDAGSDQIVLDIDSYDEEPLERIEILEP